MKENLKNECYCIPKSFNYPTGKENILTGKTGEENPFEVKRIQSCLDILKNLVILNLVILKMLFKKSRKKFGITHFFQYFLSFLNYPDIVLNVTKRRKRRIFLLF